MRFSMFLFGLIMFSGVVFTSVLTYDSIQSAYNFPRNEFNATTYDKFDSLINQTDRLTNQFQSVEVTNNDAISNFVAAGFAIIRVPYESLGIMTSLIREFGNLFFIHPKIVAMMIAIIGGLVIFGITQLLLRSPPV